MLINTEKNLQKMVKIINSLEYLIKYCGYGQFSMVGHVRAANQKYAMDGFKAVNQKQNYFHLTNQKSSTSFTDRKFNYFWQNSLATYKNMIKVNLSTLLQARLQESS